MYWERVTEEIFVFTSDRYALVNSVAILTQDGAVIIDALPFPSEAQRIAKFLAIKAQGKFHSLFLTHYHMDHVYGLCAFPENLDLIASEPTRQKLLDVGEASLAEARASDPVYDHVTLRIPTITFDLTDTFFLGAGNKTFHTISLPGHTADNMGVFYEEEEVLITGDASMPIPIVADGDWRQEIETLQTIKGLQPDTVIQGHGEVILRGEVKLVMDRYIHYLECVEEQAHKLLKKNQPRDLIWDIPLETCGLERVPLGIASHQLHVANLMAVYDQLQREQEATA